jgi:ABC-2 type transport system permease protein
MMFDDLLTVIWKERKGLFRVRGRRAQALLGLLSPVLLAIYFPLQEGAAWVESPLPLLLSFVAPLILVGLSIPDAFAGERERHTLATLLASRLPDRAILFGKIVTCVGFGWGVTLALLLASLVTVNVAHWSGRILFYTPTVLLGALAASFLVAMLTAAAGVLFSLRAATAQEAQQSLMAVLLVPPLILQFGLFFLMASDSGQERLRALLTNVTLGQVTLVIAGVLLLLDVALLAAAVARFRRARLILA